MASCLYRLRLTRFLPLTTANVYSLLHILCLAISSRVENKSLSENHFMALEQRRISPRMDSLISPFSKEMRLMKEATTTRRVDYFNLPRPLWRKLKKCLPKHTKKSTRRGGRPRAS